MKKKKITIEFEYEGDLDDHLLENYFIDFLKNQDVEIVGISSESTDEEVEDIEQEEDTGKEDEEYKREIEADFLKEIEINIGDAVRELEIWWEPEANGLICLDPYPEMPPILKIQNPYNKSSMVVFDVAKKKESNSDV